MTNEIKAVIFDMGGVLLRSMDYTKRREIAKTYGLTLKELEDLVFESQTAQEATLGKISNTDHWKAVCTALKAPVDQWANFAADFWSGDRLDTELIDFLGSLRPQHKTGLLSNAWTDAREALFDGHGCKNVFDISVFSFEIGMAKPDPAIYRYILEKLQVKAEESIFVDDNLQNIEAAAALGIHAIHFKNHQQCIEDIQAFL